MATKKLTGAEAVQVKANLRAAGCPDDVGERLLAVGAPLDLIQKLIAFALAHGGEIWAILQMILSLVPQPAP